MDRLGFALSLAWVGFTSLLLVHCGPAEHASGCAQSDCATWTDPDTGLTWQEPQSAERKTWSAATYSCDALVLAGHDDWRLPTLSELRSLARGCDATVTGGACGVTDDCLQTSCSTAECDGCQELAGPGPDGCYRPPSLTGDCMTTWTSSQVPDLPDEVWTVGFGGCHVLHYPKTPSILNTRCVRQP